MDTYWLRKHRGNPVTKPKRKSSTIVLSLLHHGTSLLYSQNNDLQKLLSDSHNNHPRPIPRKMNKKTKEFLKKFHEMSQIFEQSENPLSCDYYDISDFKKPKINKQQVLSILHLNISSISAHTDDLRTFLNLSHHKFDIISVSESRICVKHPQTTNIDLPGLNME